MKELEGPQGSKEERLIRHERRRKKQNRQKLCHNKKISNALQQEDKMGGSNAIVQWSVERCVRLGLGAKIVAFILIQQCKVEGSNT